MKKIDIQKFTKDKIDDVIEFELNLRKEENFWGWEINDRYVKSVKNSFENDMFNNSISLLAYVDNKVVGRIDASIITSHFDGSLKAYLDWICVIKSYRHHGIAQNMMNELRKQLRSLGADTLVAMIAANEEAQRFYRSLEKAEIRDEGIWIDL